MWWMLFALMDVQADPPDDPPIRCAEHHHLGTVGTRERYDAPWQDPWPGLTLASGSTAWARVGTALQAGRLPSSGTARPEELVRALPTDDRPPPPGHDAVVRAELAQSPWDEGALVVRLAVTARRPRPLDRPEAHVVAVLDASERRGVDLGVAQAALQELALALHGDDSLTLVVGGAVPLLPTQAHHEAEIEEAIRAATQARTSGSVAQALRRALEVAAAAPPHAVRKVVLISDGDIGLVEQTDELASAVAAHAQDGIGLTAVGIGDLWGRDDSLEHLARAAGGTYLHVADAQDARHQLGDRLNSLLEPAVRDVRFLVDWAPGGVRGVHRVGYHLDRLTALGPTTEPVGMEIGAGRTVVVLYEVRPHPDDRGLGTVSVRYVDPDGATITRSLALPPASDAVPFTQASPDLRVAVAAAGLGELLTGARSTTRIEPDRLWAIARDARRPEYDEDDELTKWIGIAGRLLTARGRCGF